MALQMYVGKGAKHTAAVTQDGAAPSEAAKALVVGEHTA